MKISKKLTIVIFSFLVSIFVMLFSSCTILLVDHPIAPTPIVFPNSGMHIIPNEQPSDFPKPPAPDQVNPLQKLPMPPRQP
ncbi:hypothetical protein [uncultured Sphaerochaeta sp.]|uniref:hypothetical protein n=1 Tax=uncultured Sphaerochaeta sp. TaxID=886478 RepID=UPI002A0AA000|nr:hypothetical protein [uncultured Sphaerochaeta sp.]